jgi:hypothetical protein
MHRCLLVAAALCCVTGCVPPPGSASPIEIPVTGDWTGTFESSWGAVPVTATLANQTGSQTIYGSFALAGKRAIGTVYGSLQTSDKHDPGLFYGTLDISYQLASGDLCRSASEATTTGGSASEVSVTFVTAGFPTGNCPDPPSNVRMTLRR